MAIRNIICKGLGFGGSTEWLPTHGFGGLLVVDDTAQDITHGSEYVPWKKIRFRPQPQWHRQLEQAEERRRNAELLRAEQAERQRLLLIEEAARKATEWDAFRDLVRKAAPVAVVTKAKPKLAPPRLATVIQQVFRRMATEALAAARAGKVPKLAKWNAVLADAAKPALTGYYLQGLKRHKRTKKRMTPSFGGGMDVFRPEVLQAVDEAAMKFADSTNATAKDMLETAIAKLKESLKQGLEQGEALRTLAARVKEIFSTQRAETIAFTEAQRATHAGHVMAAKEDGMTVVAWLASSDACPEICLPLDGKEVAIGTPFFSDAYGPVMHPPAHPRCMCSITLS